MKNEKECEFEGCTRSQYSARGLCAGHYQQDRAGKELKPLLDRTSFQSEKECRRCRVVKPRSEFYINQNKRLSSECKECMKDRSKIKFKQLQEAWSIVYGDKNSQ